MASAPIHLLINVDDEQRTGRLIGFNSAGKYGSGQTMIRHTSPQLALRCVRVSTSTSRLWDDLNLEAARAAGGVRWALGEFDKEPTSGTWPLAFNGDSTGMTALDYNITAAALKALLDVNPAIVTAGGVASVVKNGRSYRITFTTVGAKADFTSADNTLLPLSSVTVRRARTGDGDTKEIVVITVQRRPYALCDTWTAATAASVTVDTSIEGSPTANDTQVLTLSTGIYAGTYSLALSLPAATTAPITSNSIASPTVITDAAHGRATGDVITIKTNNGSVPSIVGVHTITVIDADTFSIPVNCTTGGTGGTYQVNTLRSFTLAATATADEILAALLTHPNAKEDAIVVSGSVGGPFIIEFTDALAATPINEMVATNINLLAPHIVTGTLNLNQDMIYAAFDAAGESATSITLVAELELEFPGESPDVPYQDSWTVKKNVLDGATSLPAPATSYPLPGLVVQIRRDITSFALLAAVATAGGAVQGMIVNIAGEPRIWGLVAGTDATDTAAGIQRPDDYDGTTNAYVWKSIL